MIWMRILFTLFVYVDKREAWNDPQVLGELNEAADGIQYFSMHTIWTMVGFVSCLHIALDGSSGDTYTVHILGGSYAMPYVLMPLCLCAVLWMLSLCVRKADPNERQSQLSEDNDKDQHPYSNRRDRSKLGATLPYLRISFTLLSCLFCIILHSTYFIILLLLLLIIDLYNMCIINCFR
jgi:hypothetical protein